MVRKCPFCGGKGLNIQYALIGYYNKKDELVTISLSAECTNCGCAYPRKQLSELPDNEIRKKQTPAHRY